MGEDNESAPLQLVSHVEKPRKLDTPIVVSPADYEAVFGLTTEESESVDLSELYEQDSVRVEALLYSLALRDLDKEIPVEGEPFSFKRNLQECKKLQGNIRKAFMASPTNRPSEDDVNEGFASAKTLLTLEKKKARWLEGNYFPKVFGDAIGQARGDVAQFLLGQKNKYKLDKFPDWDKIGLQMKDELNYLTDGHAVDSIGEASGNGIALRIPDWYTTSDSWKVYITAVHEFMHTVSHSDYERIGLMNKSDSEMRELNEAVTDLATFAIAHHRLDTGKKPVIGAEHIRQVSPLEMGYADSLLIVKQIFSQIPEQDFFDAMLNKEGIIHLRDKFATVFGKDDALKEYGEKLRKLFLPEQERTDTNEEFSNIVPFQTPHKTNLGNNA